MAEYHFDAAFSELQLRNAIRSFLSHVTRRQLDWKFGVAIAIVAVALILRRDDPAGWFEWALFGVAAFVTVFCFVLYRTHLRQSLERFRAMKTPVVHFVAQEESLAMSSDLGSAVVPWSTFIATLDNEESLLLIAKPTQLIVVPKANVDPAALDFMRAKVLSSGGAV